MSGRKNRKFKEKDIIEIDWEDSVSSNRWQDSNSYLDDPNENYVNHKSVGYLLRETNIGITIMQSYGCHNFKDNSYSTAERQLIPHKCILNIRKLK